MCTVSEIWMLLLSVVDVLFLNFSRNEQPVFKSGWKCGGGRVDKKCILTKHRRKTLNIYIIKYFIRML